ncbi:MAG: SRPBCC domain-containing protein [Candidatus Thorarchaeota archaeon]
MTEELKMSTTISAKPMEIYESWLDSKKHSAMTGSEAKVEPKVNGKFTAWDGYIEGKTIEMEPGKRIIQKWRTTDFPSGSPDSTVEITLEEVEKGTKVVLIHTEIPEGQKDDYKQGWKDFYFDPMKNYFKS